MPPAGQQPPAQQPVRPPQPPPQPPAAPPQQAAAQPPQYPATRIQQRLDPEPEPYPEPELRNRYREPEPYYDDEPPYYDDYDDDPYDDHRDRYPERGRRDRRRDDRYREPEPEPYREPRRERHADRFPWPSADGIGRTIQILSGLISLVFVLHVIFVVVGANQNSGFVSFVYSTAKFFVFGLGDVFTPQDATIGVVLNYLLAAAVYLFAGRIIARALRR
ncbi:hypothetical protein GCM10025787_37100 [Saccharopolyspora rosea]